MTPELSGRFLIDGAATERDTIVLAPGASGAMDTGWMDRISALIAGHGVRVLRFEFPYAVEQRATGKRRAPNTERVLREAWLEVIDELGPAGLVIGGKSMGGRFASMVADEAGVAGVVCLGYPFHPPGKPERLRTGHLEAIDTLVLIAQGERDTFGRREEVEGYQLSDRVRIHWLSDGDHSLKPRKASGRTQDESLAEAAEVVANFVIEAAASG